MDTSATSSHSRHFKDIIPVVWQSPTVPWVKVNMDGSVLGQHPTCRGIFRDSRGSLLGVFAGNLGDLSVFEAEIFGFSMAMEHAWQPG